MRPEGLCQMKNWKTGGTKYKYVLLYSLHRRYLIFHISLMSALSGVSCIVVRCVLGL